MPSLATVLNDRTGALGATAASLAGLPPAITAAYVMSRLLIPVGLIVLVAHHATPAQRTTMVRDYLRGSATVAPPRG